MRIYDNCYELMSETARNIWEMGEEVRPKTYQNKVIEGNEEYITKELTCEQYCLLKLDQPEALFAFSNSKDWADAEFKERIDPEGTNPGKAWTLRPNVWEEFLNDEGCFDYTYGERIYNAIQEVITLLKGDPDTRKAIIPVFNGNGFDDTLHLDGSKRIPCSMYYDLMIRTNPQGEKQLNICYHQRSSDFITHFGNDVYLAWRLMEYIANEVGVKPGYLFHTIDSLHSYKKDWVDLKTSLSTFLSI